MTRGGLQKSAHRRRDLRQLSHEANEPCPNGIRAGHQTHPFRVVKRQGGFVKDRYRGLAKNTGQIVTLFALANLWLARKRLLPLLGEVRP